MRPKSYLIIGAGIIGSSIAREILLRNLGEATVLEKEYHLGDHASGRNSGVFHSGINLEPGSMKSRICIEGNKRSRQYSKEHNVQMEECGTIVIVREGLEKKLEERELRRFEELEDRCKEAGIEYGILTKQELEIREPYVVGKKALFSTNGAIVDSKAFLGAIAKEAESLGAKYILGTKVYGIKGNRVLTTKGDFRADFIINAAGLYADKIAHMIQVGLEYEIIPFRGEYMKIYNVPINSMVYTPPDFDFPFLGIHLTKTIDGRVIAGPNAVLSFGRESYNKEVNWREILDMVSKPNFWGLISSRKFLKIAYENARTSLSDEAFLREVRTISPYVKEEDISLHKAGIRAQLVDRKGRMIDDMLILEGKNSIHILNAVSPGMTCSLAFAPYLVDGIEKRFS